MKTFQQCCDEVAKKYLYSSFQELMDDHKYAIALAFKDEAAEFYREEGIREAIKLMPLYGEKEIHTEMRIRRFKQTQSCECETCKRIVKEQLEREQEIIDKLKA